MHKEPKPHHSMAKLPLRAPFKPVSREWDRLASHAPIADLEFILTLFFIQVAVTVQIIQSPAFLPACSSCPLGSFIFFSFFIQNSRDVFPTVACNGGDIFSSAGS